MLADSKYGIKRMNVIELDFNILNVEVDTCMIVNERTINQGQTYVKVGNNRSIYGLQKYVIPFVKYICQCHK